MIFNKTYNSVKKNGQTLFNIYFFLNITGWFIWNIYKKHAIGTLDFFDVSFAVQTLALMSVVLIRKKYKSIDKNIFNQLIATIAFFSGAAFMGQPQISNINVITLSKSIMFISNIIGAINLLNLGKSFGVLIAYREIKTNGLYSIVRHPMYANDILLRIGYVISHLNIYTFVIFTLSTACYIYRAILEEKFLSLNEEYKRYMQKVRYRFIPYIF